MSGLIALAKPRRIKTSHRRRRRVASDHLLYILNNPLSGTDPTGYQSRGSVCAIGTSGNANGCTSGAGADIPTGTEKIDDGKPKPASAGGSGSSGGTGTGGSTNNGAQPAQTATAGADGRNPNGATPITEKEGSTTSPVPSSAGLPMSTTLNVSIEDFAKNPAKYLNDAIFVEGFRNNADVTRSGVETNSLPVAIESHPNMTEEQRAAINRLAAPVMRYLEGRISASDGKNMEVRLEFGVSDSELRVVGAALNAQGGKMIRQPNSIMLVHWHFPNGELIPSSADHQPVKRNGTLTGVVTPIEDARVGRRCCQIWEVGMPNPNNFRYRSIKGKNVGPWREHKDWK